jgi:hypothetical protein
MRSQIRDPGWVKIRIWDPGKTSRIRNTAISTVKSQLLGFFVTAPAQEHSNGRVDADGHRGGWHTQVQDRSVPVFLVFVTGRGGEGGVG